MGESTVLVSARPPLAVLDCGHLPTPNAYPGTGYGRCPKTDVRRCYACCDEDEREAMKTADRYTAYVCRTGKHITSWPGGVLGRITAHVIAEAQVTPTGGTWRARRVWVTDVHGGTWYGVGSDGMDVINLRRVKQPA